MNVIWIIKGLWSSPDHSKCCISWWCSSCVWKFHSVTVYSVTQQVGIHTGHSSFNVELTHKPCLCDELLQKIQKKNHFWYSWKQDNLTVQEKIYNRCRFLFSRVNQRQLILTAILSTLTLIDLSVPDETKISWLSRKVILGQNEGPLLMLGPTRWKKKEKKFRSMLYIHQMGCKIFLWSCSLSKHKI